MNKLISEIHENKTFLKNIPQICIDLNINQIHFVKYISKKLNTFHQKKEAGIILAGKFDNNTILEVIYKYILEFVLCKKCNLPEIINKKCKSCGVNF